MKRLLLIISLSISGLVAGQGMPYGLWTNSSTQQVWFVQFNPSNGLKNDIAIVTGLANLHNGSAHTFNTDLNQYVCWGYDGQWDRLWTINATNGAIVSNPLFPDNLTGMEYNCNDSMIYAIRGTGANRTLVKIHPTNAQVDSIVGLSNVSGFIDGGFSLDTKKGWYNCVVLNGSAYQLRSYDIFSGALINNNAFPDQVTHHEYNCEDSTIYGLWNDNGTMKLEAVDLVAGTHSTSTVLTGVSPGTQSDMATINASGEYSFSGFVGTTPTVHVWDVSASTSLASTTFSEAVRGWEEPNCCPGRLAGVKRRFKEVNLFLSPNPAVTSITLESSEVITGYRVVDFGGKEVLKGSAHGSKVTVGIDALSSGIYFIQIEGDQFRAVKKFVVTD